MIYVAFQCILAPEDNREQNSDYPPRNEYQKHVVCSYGYKLVGVNDWFSKPLKLYLGEDAVYNFINSMIKKSN